jgi:hypothetical protein
MRNLILSVLLIISDTISAQLPGKIQFQGLPEMKPFQRTDLSQEKYIQFYQARTFPHDTIGLVFHNEWVRFTDEMLIRKGIPTWQVISPYVTQEEWDAFQRYVMDSLTRETLFFVQYDDDDALNWIQLTKKQRKLLLHTTINREELRKQHPLSYTEKLEYSSDVLPSIVDFFISHKSLTPDQRKLNYRMRQLHSIDTQKHESINLTINHSCYMPQSERTFDLPHLLATNYKSNKQLRQLPVIVQSPAQIRAFCNWKTSQLQQQIDREQLPYKVFVTLPSWEEAGDSLLPLVFTTDYSDMAITYKDYSNFMYYIQDSIMRERLYQTLLSDRKASQFLSFNSNYFDGTEFVIFDESDRNDNRSVFHLNYHANINWRDLEIKQCLAPLLDSTHQLGKYLWRMNSSLALYAFSYKDYRTLDFKNYVIEELTLLKVKKSTEIHYRFAIPNRYDMDLRSADTIIPNQDIIAITNDNFYSKSFSVNSVPRQKSGAVNWAAFSTFPDSLMTELIYDQAIAYYHWKYGFTRPFPSEEQFKALQRGEIVRETTVIQPYAPVFRYVIRIQNALPASGIQ